MTTGAHVGTAGWSIPRDRAAAFPASGTGLERYAAVLKAAEINTTFYRRHRASTFERWHASVGADFRFAVKLPRAITHESELSAAKRPLAEFFSDVAPLGDKLGPVLVQLPRSLAFDARRASGFFRAPRAETLLIAHEVARVVADPPRPREAEEAGGARALVYLRMHGSPRAYYSEYGAERVGALATRIREAIERGATAWCVFDNTASGAAASDALRLRDALATPRASLPRSERA